MNHSVPTIFIVFMFLASTGCLDALTNSGDSGKFWGEDCDDVSEEICPSGKAPDFSLVDQNGDTVNLTLYEDKIVVVSFVYTYCPDICPALTYQLRKLSEELGDEYGESVEFITITVDPERDTPERTTERIRKVKKVGDSVHTVSIYAESQISRNPCLGQRTST